MATKDLTTEINNVWKDNKKDKEFEKRLKKWVDVINGCEEQVIKARKQFHQWDPLRVYTSISKTEKAIFSLRFYGQEVGEIVPADEDVFLVLKGHSKKNKEWFNMTLKDGKYSWAGNEAKAFRKHFKDFSKNTGGMPETHSLEHRVESKFIQEMQKGSGKFRLKKSPIFISPVTIASGKGRVGIPFQAPLPISGSNGKPKKGNGYIDILSRRSKGRGHRVNLCIWELKAPGKYASAAKQAYIYALTLLKILRNSKSGPDWYKAYGFKSLIPKSLEIEAVVAITKDQEGKYEEEKAILDKTVSYKIGDDKIKLYVAYYEETSDGIKILKPNPFE